MTSFLLPFAGTWALGILVLFIFAIRLSYAIEKKVGKKSRWGLPHYTNLFASAFGGSAGEPVELRAMRRRLRWMLAACLAGMAMMAAVVILAGPPGATGNR